MRLREKILWTLFGIVGIAWFGFVLYAMGI